MSRSNALSMAAAMLVVAACSSQHSPSNTSTDASTEVSDAGPLAQLESDTGVAWTYRAGADYGSVVQLAPNRVPKPTVNSATTAVQAAEAFLKTYGGILGIGDFASELSLVFTPVPDTSGITWVSFQQSEHSVPVYERRILVAYDPNGSIGFVWSGYVPDLQGLSVTPAQTADQAVAAAQADMVKELDAGTLGDFAGASTPELVIYPGTSTSNLAYYVELAYSVAERNYWIDAQSGAVLFSMDPRVGGLPPLPALGTIPSKDPAGTQVPGVASVGSWSDTKQLTVFQTSAFDYMQQQIPDAGGSIWVQMLGSGNAAVPSADSSSSEVSAARDAGSPLAWVAAPGFGLLAPMAVDAYQYVFISEQWWSQNFQRRSYDNAGADIPIVLDPGSSVTDSACWDPSILAIRVGRAKNLPLPASAALDAMGHEYTHAVNQFTLMAGLTVNMGGMQGMALNEGLADEFGQFIENDYSSPLPYTQSDKTLCEGVSASAPRRNLSEPHLTSQPNNVYDPLYTNPPLTTTVAGQTVAVDEHYFDGVPNNAWYLATHGGQNSTSSIYVPNTPGSNFEQVYGSTMLAGCSGSDGSTGCGGNVGAFDNFARALTATAVMQHGRCSPAVQSVGCSWYAVGVLDPDTIANAFGVNACQCPNDGTGTYCGTQIVYGANANWLYTCTDGKLNSITDCASTFQSCGSSSPSPDGTPIDPGICKPNGSVTAGQSCGGAVTCACPLACIQGVCSSLTSADCIGASGTPGSDAGCASTAATLGCGSGTVTLTYGTQEVLKVCRKLNLLTGIGATSLIDGSHAGVMPVRQRLSEHNKWMWHLSSFDVSAILS